MVNLSYFSSSASHCGMFRRALGKSVGFVGYTIQYGCIAHCAFEYIGEFVSVSLILFSILISDSSSFIHTI